MYRQSRRAVAAAVLIAALISCNARCQSAPAPRLDGFNVIAAPKDPFGSERAKRSLARARRIGANAIAIVPFFWQANPASPDLVRGRDMSDGDLRVAIRDAHALGLAAVVKPHVWVPQSWAGAIAMHSDADWQRWFADYASALDHLARIAEDEKAEALAIGTELANTSQRPQWNELIAAVRRHYSGRLLYFAHNLEEVETVPFWHRLDAIGITLYPPLGADGDQVARLATMRTTVERLDALSARVGKPVIVGEVGLRSAQGAAAMPWQSAEERASLPDAKLQADVVADWMSVLDRPSIRGILIWRWFTDPAAGGLADTDFTVQGKPAERVLRCVWTRHCDGERAAGLYP
jgi:hypothetical protein